MVCLTICPRITIAQNTCSITAGEGMRTFVPAVLFVLGLVGGAACLAAPPPTPPNLSAEQITSNPWFTMGVNAIGQNIGAMTVSIDVRPADTLVARINQAHQGLAVSGWNFTSQSAVETGGATTTILLTYRRGP